MVALEIKRCILKYLGNEATSEELDYLSSWISIPGNEDVFNDFIKTHYEITTAISKPDVDKIKSTLLKDIERDKRMSKNYVVRRILQFAAVVVILLSLGYLYRQDTFSQSKKTAVLNPKNEPVTIILDGGTTKILGSDQNLPLKDADGKVIAKQRNAKLTYSQLSTNGKLVYNTLNVPQGKRFGLTLSDGTHVYLNSGSELRYPVNFVKSRDREVFLKGEAYFEVKRDEAHPFKVHIGQMHVKVLGTVFNISNYPEDLTANTVLVKGSVALYQTKDNESKPGQTLLEPGFKGEWDKNGDDISIERVDTEDYTAWVQGKLVFRNTSFLKIRQALKRHYNVKIRNTNTELDKQLFDATFDIETIEEVLESFNKSFAIEYKIINKEVIIE